MIAGDFNEHFEWHQGLIELSLQNIRCQMSSFEGATHLGGHMIDQFFLCPSLAAVKDNKKKYAVDVHPIYFSDHDCLTLLVDIDA